MIVEFSNIQNRKNRITEHLQQLRQSIFKNESNLKLICQFLLNSYECLLLQQKQSVCCHQCIKIRASNFVLTRKFNNLSIKYHEYIEKRE